MRRRPTQEEYDIIARELTDLGMSGIVSRMTPENTYINGATVYRVSDSPEGKVFSYVEDDVVDEMGYPYLFEESYYGYFGELGNGRRVISVYVNGGQVVIPADGESYVIYGAVCETGTLELDMGKVKKLPIGPIVLDIPREPARLVSPSEFEKIDQTARKYGKFTGSKIVGDIALCLLWVILIGLAYIFTFVAIDPPSPNGAFWGLTIGAVVLLVGLCVGSCVFLNNLHIRRLAKLKYIKPVMVVGIQELKVNAGTREIAFVEWCGGEVVFRNVMTGYSSFFLQKDVGFGDIIYMLTPTPEVKSYVFFNGAFINL